MKSPQISFERFKLTFLPVPHSGIEDEGNEGEEESSLEKMEALIPAEAVFLGSIDSEVSNWTSWKVIDHYYLFPWTDGEFDWALFRISWDDNWSRFDWFADARIKGESDADKAAYQMVKSLMGKWGFDLNKSEYALYKEFLDSITP
jgi:hypothetical protein